MNIYGLMQWKIWESEFEKTLGETLDGNLNFEEQV